jgi:hypothetical protein
LVSCELKIQNILQALRNYGAVAICSNINLECVVHGDVAESSVGLQRGEVHRVRPATTFNRADNRDVTDLRPMHDLGIS